MLRIERIHRLGGACPSQHGSARIDIIADPGLQQLHRPAEPVAGIDAAAEGLKSRLAACGGMVDDGQGDPHQGSFDLCRWAPRNYPNVDIIIGDRRQGFNPYMDILLLILSQPMAA
jgi:hypothetical protein